MKEIFKLHAEVCKTLANPKRLEIIYALKDGEKSTGELVDILKASKANVSQHLSVLKNCGVIRSRREGVNIYHSISSPKIVKACMLMREVLLEQLEEKREVLKRLKRSG